MVFLNKLNGTLLVGHDVCGIVFSTYDVLQNCLNYDLVGGKIMIGITLSIDGVSGQSPIYIHFLYKKSV